jgi:hypothetical protein
MSLYKTKYSHTVQKERKQSLPFSIGVFMLSIGLMFSAASCNDYLDVVPDNVTTIDHAFALKNEAEKYLFTCYSYIPKNGDGWYNIGMMSGDEIWLPQNNTTYANPANQIALGRQNSNAPLLDVWRGNSFGTLGGPVKRLFAGIRSCNIFLENVSNRSKIPDLTLDVRVRWLGEAEFLKAYYHFYLLRMYGPIPIIDVNVPIDADVQASYVTRKPVDECVNYISSLLDSAAAKLPNVVENELTETGRITKPIVLALKAGYGYWRPAPCSMATLITQTSEATTARRCSIRRMIWLNGKKPKKPVKPLSMQPKKSVMSCIRIPTIRTGSRRLPRHSLIYGKL